MDKVQHFEIPVDDMARAQKFYKEIFGWQIMEVPGMDYTMVHTVAIDESHTPKEPGAINGGMYKRSPNGEGPVIVVTVEAIEKHIENIKQQGCEIIMGPIPIGDMGLYAQFKDSEGNTLGLWQTLRK